MKITDILIKRDRDQTGKDVIACWVSIDDGQEFGCGSWGIGAGRPPNEVAASLKCFAAAIEAMDKKSEAA